MHVKRLHICSAAGPCVCWIASQAKKIVMCLAVDNKDLLPKGTPILYIMLPERIGAGAWRYCWEHVPEMINNDHCNHPCVMVN